MKWISIRFEYGITYECLNLKMMVSGRVLY